MLFFKLHDLNTAWLALPIDQWPTDAGYQRFYEIVKIMYVVNDSAERAVKDVSDFADYSGDPTRRDEVVHLVNHH